MSLYRVVLTLAHGYLAFPQCRVLASLVPRPSATTPVGKLEREKRKEGLVNRHTITCSSAGMLVELIKTSLSKLIAYLWETVRNSGHVRVLKFLSTNWAMKA